MKMENCYQLTFDDIVTDNSDRFGNWKELLDTMTLYGASLLISAMIKNMDKDRLTDADYWYECLKVEVDEDGVPL